MTLNAFFGKTVVHTSSGAKFSVAEPLHVDLSFGECPKCKRDDFKSKAGYLSHVQHCMHPAGDEVAKDDDVVFMKVHKVDGRRNAKGASSRRSYTYKLKKQYLSMVYDTTKKMKISRKKAIRRVAAKTGVPISTLERWAKCKDVILDLASNHLTRDKRQMFVRKWVRDRDNLEETLGAREVRNRRRKGLKAKRRFVIARAKQLRNMPNLVRPEMKQFIIKLGRSWCYRGFINRQVFSLRRCTNRKPRDINDCKPTCFKFHQLMFDTLRAEPRVHDVYGHYEPKDIFNFDQVPAPFVCEDNSRTLEDKGASRVWCRQPGSGLEKRQCSIHVTACADSHAPQPKPIVIFRGSGVRILKSREAALEWVCYSL